MSLQHYLRKITTEGSQGKNLISIDYDKELLSGIRLREEAHLTTDGLLDKIVKYHDTVDSGGSAVSIPVVCESESYEYRLGDEGLNPSEKGLYKRVKVIEYYFVDGILDTKDRDSGRSGAERETSKEVPKLYNSNREILEVGEKRRKNIISVFSENAGAALLVLQHFTTKKEAYDAMRKIAIQHGASFTAYERYAVTNIYSDIQSETGAQFDWLDVFAPTNEQIDGMSIPPENKAQLKGSFQIYGLEDIQGKDIRTYFVEKLKGLVK